MDKKIINKFKKEFDTWLDGEEVLCRYINEDFYADTGWMDLTENANFFSANCIYIIKDKYAELRKAIAEGKTIQYNRATEHKPPKDDWVDFKPEIFEYDVSFWRVKPEPTYLDSSSNG